MGWQKQIISTKPLSTALTPVGSIIAWLLAYESAEDDIPQGWESCDGSIIEAASFTPMATPDLSTYERFLRGTSAESAGQFEDVQDHLHLDPGLKIFIMGIHIIIMDMYIMRLSLRTTYFLGVHDKDKKICYVQDTLTELILAVLDGISIL